MKLTDAEMRLFALGTAMYGTNHNAVRIIAQVLNERHQAKKKPKRRRKK